MTSIKYVHEFIGKDGRAACPLKHKQKNDSGVTQLPDM